MTQKNQTDKITPTAVVVNDDATQLSILTSLLNKAGIHTLSFTSARDALLAMDKKQPFDLIVTDIYMPEIDGWRFCRLLRSPEYADFNRIPILVVSATFAGEEVSRITADLGANAFLSSPVDGKQFFETVKSLLAGELTQNPLHILIVEDSRTLAGLLRKAFIKHGYQVTIAHTLESALSEFDKEIFDVAVIDYHLPDGKGEGLLTRFKTVRPEAVCIMMTTDPKPGLAVSWMRLGAAGYLRKPFDPEYLLELCSRTHRERALLRIEDLMERRTQELRESEEKYRSVFAAESDAIFLIDKKTGAILEVNNSACDLYGYTQEELIRLKNIDLSAEPEKTMQATSKTKRSIPLRYHKKKDGTIFPVDISANGLILEGREVVFAAIRDITDRKMAEKRLQQNEERLRLSLSGADLGMWDWDIISGAVTFNERWASMLGYTLDEIQPNVTAWEKLIHPDDMPNVMKTLNAHIKGKSDEYKTEYRLRHKSGQWIYVLDCGRVIERDVQGKALRACGTHLDITERKKSDEERECLISELKAALEKVKKLSGLLPICSFCKKIRDDKGYWNQLEAYIQNNSEAEFSHSICQECAEKHYPDLDIYDD